MGRPVDGAIRRNALAGREGLMANPFQNECGRWVAEYDGEVHSFDTEEEALYWLKKHDDKDWVEEPE